MMKRAHPLGGLMAFISQGEWREIFGQLLGEYLGGTLDAFGLTTESLIQVLGKDRAAKLWGCILEDLISRHCGTELRNVVDDYLKGAGRTEHQYNQNYMLAVRQSVMSLYEVVETTPGKSLTVRDAIRNQKPVIILEEGRTSACAAGDWIAARIIPKDDDHVITGGFLSLTERSADSVLDEMRSLVRRLGIKGLNALDVRQLRLCAPVFMQAWLLENLPVSLTAERH
jgi:hypothetical protein